MKNDNHVEHSNNNSNNNKKSYNQGFRTSERFFEVETQTARLAHACPQKTMRKKLSDLQVQMLRAVWHRVHPEVQSPA